MRKIVQSVIAVLLLSVLINAHPSHAQNSGKIERVIIFGVDAGGGKYLQKFMEEFPEKFDNFQRLKDEGAFTFNARADYFVTVTQPNFSSMITGRPTQTVDGVKGAVGHYWRQNYAFPDKNSPKSLHALNPQNGYTQSVFDVAHDNGLKTGMYWSPNRFYHLAITSYGPEFGRKHKNGKNKIDYAVGANVTERIEALAKDKPDFAFIYFSDADGAGHKYGYLGEEYRDAFAKVNSYLGKVLDIVDNDPDFKDKTAIILTADHGGKPGTKRHRDYHSPYVYTVPLIVWGPGIAKGVDLYSLNQSTRQDPGDKRPEYALKNQPIRNGEVGNLALQLLGLPKIPGSFINAKQDLNVH